MNKHIWTVAIGIAATLAVTSTSARDDRIRLPIADAMGAPEAKTELGDNIKFFFGDAAHPAVGQSYGVFTSNKKSNGFGKDDKVACNWAFLSAMKSFRDRAVNEGGNAVINIKSIYKGNELNSATEYECGAGNLMVGVTFRGEVVKLK